jgi:protein-tyrosine-phosphatase
MKSPRTILFVCLGNICRSPMAEELFRLRIAERGLAGRYRVRSAGIIGSKNHVPPIEAILTAKDHGVDLRGHLSTPLTRELLNEADLVVAMDRANVEQILNLVPDLGPRLRLLKQYSEGAIGFDVPDPIACPREVYQDSYRQIVDGVEGLIAAIEKDEGEAAPEDSEAPAEG